LRCSILEFVIKTSAANLFKQKQVSVLFAFNSFNDFKVLRIFDEEDSRFTSISEAYHKAYCQARSEQFNGECRTVTEQLWKFLFHYLTLLKTRQAKFIYFETWRARPEKSPRQIRGTNSSSPDDVYTQIICVRSIIPLSVIKISSSTYQA